MGKDKQSGKRRTRDEGSSKGIEEPVDQFPGTTDDESSDDNVDMELIRRRIGNVSYCYNKFLKKPETKKVTVKKEIVSSDEEDSLLFGNKVKRRGKMPEKKKEKLMVKGQGKKASKGKGKFHEKGHEKKAMKGKAKIAGEGKAKMPDKGERKTKKCREKGRAGEQSGGKKWGEGWVYRENSIEGVGEITVQPKDGGEPLVFKGKIRFYVDDEAEASSPNIASTSKAQGGAPRVVLGLFAPGAPNAPPPFPPSRKRNYN